MKKEELQAIRHRAEMAESALSCTKDWVTELALCDALEQEQAKCKVWMEDAIRYAKDYDELKIQLEETKAEIELKESEYQSLLKKHNQHARLVHKYRQALKKIKARHYNDKTGQIASKALEESE